MTDDFKPYITKMQAQLLQFPPPANDMEPGDILIAWQEAFQALFNYTNTLFEHAKQLDKSLTDIEEALLQTARTVKNDKPFIAMKDWVDLRDSKYDPE